jgi:hypothetical protein
MFATLLGRLLWSQPRTNSTAETQRQHPNLNLDAIVPSCNGFVNGIREAIANRLWKTWKVTVHVLIVGINKLFYCKTPWEQRQKSSPHWEIAADRFETLMSALGDWIQVQTQPFNSRKRRIIATAYRNQRTTQFVAMSVLRCWHMQRCRPRGRHTSTQTLPTLASTSDAQRVFPTWSPISRGLLCTATEL